MITKQMKELSEVNHLDEIMNAIARVIEKPHDVFAANKELWEALEKHGRMALREWDEDQQHKQELEGENEELRRRLIKAGISHRVGDAA